MRRGLVIAVMTAGAAVPCAARAQAYCDGRIAAEMPHSTATTTGSRTIVTYQVTLRNTSDRVVALRPEFHAPRGRHFLQILPPDTVVVRKKTTTVLELGTEQIVRDRIEDQRIPDAQLLSYVKLVCEGPAR